MSHRIVFMGTGPFAYESLHALIDAHYAVVGVYTKPQKQSGRGRKCHADNPVRTYALQQKIPLYDPVAPLRDPETFAALCALHPDSIIVAAYGKILPQCVLDLPRYGCINVHGSLLPRWRGASPIQSALVAGDHETGITLMRMDRGLDTGPLIATSRRAIPSQATAGDLFPLLAADGAALLTQTLPAIFKGTAPLIPQDDTKATTCNMIRKDDGYITWTETAQTIVNRFRGFTPWPGIFVVWHRQAKEQIRIRICACHIGEKMPNTPPGTVSYASGMYMIATRDGLSVCVTHLQREGKSVVSAEAFHCGYPDFHGTHLSAHVLY